MCIYISCTCIYFIYTYILTYSTKKIFLQDNAVMKKNHFSTVVATEHYGAASRKVKITIQR